MKKAILLLSLSLLGFAEKAQTVSPSAPPTYEFKNGKWFDGQKFVQRTFYTVSGRLTARKPVHIDKVVDLSDKYVVPPFGEAHNHNLDWAGEEPFARLKRTYLEAGIFYVKNPNSLPRSKQQLVGKINSPLSLDGIFSNGGLTASGGHPIEIVVPQRGFKPDDGEGAFYWTINDTAELDRKWPAIAAGQPDFIKTYLLYSEEFLKRKNDDKYFGWKGLDPRVLTQIVQRAHRTGLRVSTHVETATDFHNALIAGVDEINHTPGFRPERNDVTNFVNNLSRYLIAEADARLAARRHVVVVTTMGETIDWTFDEKQSVKDRAAVRQMIIDNLHVLQHAGALIAIGSDSFRRTSGPEALSLNRLGVFNALALLKMWCETTSATIFPGRKIGHLKEGFEASFLVLSGDPIIDFTNTQKIEMRVKQGYILIL